MLCLALCQLLLAGPVAQPPTATIDDGLHAADLAQIAHPIRSIDPREEDFADLQPLKVAIGAARVVALGEQSHGDGPVFLAKCRLVKFLHEQMGFDVLVWESTEYDCREADRALRDPGADLDQAWQKGIFSIWGRSAQVRPVIEYVRAQATAAHPLEVAGMDCQFSSGHPEWWLNGMEKFLAPLGDDHPASRVLAAIRQDDKSLMDSKAPRAKLDGLLLGIVNLAQLVDKDREKLTGAHGADEFAFMRRTIDDAGATVRMTMDFARKREPNGQPGPGSGNVRDQRMGENLVWLANQRYKGRKLIVWAASFHEANDISAIRGLTRPDIYKGVITEGTVAKRTLKDDLYTITFEAHGGTAAPCFRPDASEIGPSPAGSLGEMLAGIDRPFLFVDFRSTPPDHWLRQPQVMRPLGYMPMSAVWPDQFDAVFFVRTMFPSTKEKLAPEGAALTVK